jgi:dephospho-CoA kinase
MAAGKSTALGAFARAGCPVLSSDDVVHELYRRPAIRDAVVERVGPQVLDADGEVDRAVLGAVAFGDPDLLAFLERLVHPLVAVESERFRREAEEAGARVAVQEIPLLFERGGADRFDRTVLITAPDELRRARDSRAVTRQAHQLPEDEKRALADEVFVNDGSLEALDAWVAQLVRRLGG